MWPSPAGGARRGAGAPPPPGAAARARAPARARGGGGSGGAEAVLADLLHADAARSVPVPRGRAGPAFRDARGHGRGGGPACTLGLRAGMTVLRIERILAPNPGVFTLEGTNSWIVGDDPSIVIDPGPDDAGHLDEIARAAGAVEAVIVTHDHEDHASGASRLAALVGAPLHAFRLEGAS